MEKSATGDLSRNENVRWILNCSVSDLNWKGTVPRLTDEELRYCHAHIQSKTGRAALEREAKKRELVIFDMKSTF